MELKTAEEALGKDLAEIYRREYRRLTDRDADMLYMPATDKAKWWCSCGVMNLISQMHCRVCGASIADLSRIMWKDYLQGLYDKEHPEEARKAAEEEAARKAAEEEAARKAAEEEAARKAAEEEVARKAAEEEAVRKAAEEEETHIEEPIEETTVTETPEEASAVLEEQVSDSILSGDPVAQEQPQNEPMMSDRLIVPTREDVPEDWSLQTEDKSETSGTRLVGTWDAASYRSGASGTETYSDGYSTDYVSDISEPIVDITAGQYAETVISDEPEEEPEAAISIPDEPEEEPKAAISIPDEPEEEPEAAISIPDEPEEEPEAAISIPEEPEEESAVAINIPDEPEDESAVAINIPDEPEDETNVVIGISSGEEEESNVIADLGLSFDRPSSDFETESEISSDDFAQIEMDDLTSDLSEPESEEEQSEDEDDGQVIKLEDALEMPGFGEPQTLDALPNESTVEFLDIPTEEKEGKGKQEKGKEKKGLLGGLFGKKKKKAQEGKRPIEEFHLIDPDEDGKSANIPLQKPIKPLDEDTEPKVILDEQPDEIPNETVDEMPDVELPSDLLEKYQEAAAELEADETDETDETEGSVTETISELTEPEADETDEPTVEEPEDAWVASEIPPVSATEEVLPEEMVEKHLYNKEDIVASEEKPPDIADENKIEAEIGEDESLGVVETESRAFADAKVDTEGKEEKALEENKVSTVLAENDEESRENRIGGEPTYDDEEQQNRIDIGTDDDDEEQQNRIDIGTDDDDEEQQNRIDVGTDDDDEEQQNRIDVGTDDDEEEQQNRIDVGTDDGDEEQQNRIDIGTDDDENDAESVYDDGLPDEGESPAVVYDGDIPQIVFPDEPSADALINDLDDWDFPDATIPESPMPDPVENPYKDVPPVEFPEGPQTELTMNPNPDNKDKARPFRNPGAAEETPSGQITQEAAKPQPELTEASRENDAEEVTPVADEKVKSKTGSRTVLIIAIVIVAIAIAVVGVFTIKEIIGYSETAGVIETANSSISKLEESGIPTQEDFNKALQDYNAVPYDKQNEVENAELLEKYKDVDLKTVRDIATRIDSLTEDSSFADVLAIEQEYDRLTMQERQFVDGARLEEFKTMNEMEVTALRAISNIRTLLPDSANFKVISVAVKDDTGMSMSYRMQITYSYVDTQGTLKENTTYLSMMSDQDDVAYNEAVNTGHPENYYAGTADMEAYNECDSAEVSLDTDKLMYFLDQPV